MKYLIAGWVLAGLLFSTGLNGYAESSGTETATKQITDAGNKLCPISGEPVSGASFVEYQGKRYGLCCPMCRALFLKDPEKYLAQMEVKEKASASAEVSAEASASEEMEKDMEQGSL